MKYTFAAILFFIAASGVRAGTLYDNTVLGNNPVAFFPLAETSGTTANNLANTAENGTYQGGVTLGIPGGPDGNGAGFTPTGQYVGIPLYSALEVTSSFSVEAWIDVASTNANPLASIFAINRALNSTGLSFAIFDDQLVLGMNNFSTNYSETALPKLPNGVWDQVAVTWSKTVNGGAPQFYIDGILVGNNDSNTFAQSLNLTGAPGANIGVEFSNGSNGGRWVHGDIEDVSFYNTVLSSTQIAADYAAGVPEPSSILLGAGGLLLLIAARWLR